MPKLDYIDFQSRTQPLAFFITFRCYGTWLHGDERGAVDRHKYHTYGSPGLPPNKKLLKDENIALKHSPIQLNQAQREVVEVAIREVCTHRHYSLHAINVRTNHVHSVVTAPRKPDYVMDSFKGICDQKTARGGSVEPRH